MSTHFPLQILSFLVLLPATPRTKYLGVPVIQGSLARLPWILQFFLAIVVADTAEYFIHLAFHKFHSSRVFMPFVVRRRRWIGSRARAPHFVDDTLMRGFILVTLVLGFSQSIISGVSDFRHPSRHLDSLQLRPQREVARKISGHAQISPLAPHLSKEGVDKNFAIHFPWIDKIFGTYYFPDKWPELYGLDGEELSSSFFGQTIEAFQKRKPAP